MEFDLQTNTQIKTFSRKRILFCSIFIGIIVFFVGFAIGYVAFNSGSTKAKPATDKMSQDKKNQEIQQEFLRNIDADRLGENLRYFSSQVHIAGSKRQKDLANFLAAKWKEYDFDQVEMPEYSVLLSAAQESQPNKITVEDGQGFVDYEIKGKMKIFPDPRINKTVDFYPFYGYSPNKTVEGQLVYVNYGTEDDYEELKRMNISVEGKIVLAKYPIPSLAAKKGAIGLIVFPNPDQLSPEGTSRSATYPNTPWLSKDGVQLQSSFSEPYVGDKLTPGLPATEWTYRKPYKNDSSFLNIPVQPISYGQAEELLKRMEGPNVPAHWNIRKFSMTLKTGPGFYNDSLRIKLQVNTQTKIKKIYNVIGTITGSEEPDRYIIVGNHRDSWVFGAADAVSGTTTTHEIARVLGTLKKIGWRPRRTIKICSWGGEEWGLFGSSEWVEQYAKILNERAIAYINLDIAVQGNFVLRARASPLFKEITHKWAKKVTDPMSADGQTTIFDTWLRNTPSSFFPQEPHLFNNFRASDYVMFYHYLGIPTSDYGYWFGYKNRSTMYPVYHTTEDTFYWLQKFVDPKFKVHKAMAQFSGGIVLDIADSVLIPYNVYDFAKVLNVSYHILDQSHFMKSDDFLNKNMKHLDESVQEFLKQAKKFEEKKSKITAHHKSLQIRMINDKTVEVEKAFIAPDGLLGKPYDRHVAFNYGFKNINEIQATFPGVTHSAQEALETNNWEPVRKQLSLAIHSVRMATDVIKL